MVAAVIPAHLRKMHACRWSTITDDGNVRCGSPIAIATLAADSDLVDSWCMNPDVTGCQEWGDT